jgi:tetratricopeptide (TPR) repeat protein
MSDASAEVIQRRLEQACALQDAGQLPEAEAALREALRQLDTPGQEVPALRAYALHRLRCGYLAQGRYAEAINAATQELAILERHAGPENPRLAEPLEAIAWAHYRTGQWEPAVSAYERVLALYRSAGPPAEPRLASALADLGKCFHRQQRYPEAVARYREAAALLVRHPGTDPQQADLLYHLGAALRSHGQIVDAECSLLRSLALFERAPAGARLPLQGMVLAELVRVMETQGRLLEAEADARQAVELAEAEAPPGHPLRSDTLRDLGRTLHAQGKRAEAGPVLERALAASEHAYGPHSPIVAACLHNLAGFHFEAGRVDEAGALEERAIAVYGSQPQAEAVRPALGDCYRCLARVREAQGRPAEARELVVRAESLGPRPDPSPTGTVAIELSKDHA